MDKENIELHNTRREIEFLNGIGTHSESESVPSRYDLLKGYINAADKRVEWGLIDKYEVVAHATKLLLREVSKNELLVG